MELTIGHYTTAKLLQKESTNEVFMIGKYYGATTLRDRFHFLFTLGAVIRSESVFKADLSDLMDFTFHQENEPDPYYVLVMRIGFGKIVRDCFI